MIELTNGKQILFMVDCFNYLIVPIIAAIEVYEYKLWHQINTHVDDRQAVFPIAVDA